LLLSVQTDNLQIVIRYSNEQAADLIPHVIKAARIVLMNPDNQASVEHFELLKKQWMENAEKLRGLVDEAVDTAAFICANG